MTDTPYDPGRTVTLTADERSALRSALDDYMDNRLIACDREHDHGDETDCEGWGPTGVVILSTAARKVGR